MNQIYQCILADFKQRTRQQRFIVTLLLMSVLTLLYFPPPDAQYQTLVINGYRGIYNSAWIGLCLAMLNVMFLPIICFYLVKNALELDRQSHTCELIAATPINKQAFVFAKWAVNIFILLIIVFVMLLTSLFIQMYYGESYQFDVWAFLWPQLVFVLPLLFAISSIAILFESIKWLRGGLGNVAYFFLWVGFITQSIEGVSGIGAILENLESEVATRFPTEQGMSNIGITTNNAVNTFLWDGFTPSSAYLVGMLPLLGLSLIGLTLAFWCFDRFSHTPAKRMKKNFPLSIHLAKVATLLDTLFITATKSFAFTRFFRLELKLMLKGQTNSWIIGLLVLNMGQLFVSQELLISALIPLSLLWCVLVISPLGQLEKQANTLEIMTYSKRTPILQNTASLIAGCTVLLIACFGAFARLIIMAEWLLIIQLCIGIVFMVSLAYFCGAFTQTKRMFEVLFPAIWYLGPIQTGLYLDFIGVNSQASWHAGMPYYFLACAATMVTLTMSVKQTR
ncbi:hypothetical protein C7Y70_04245 [Pseudoalteromonas sp. KS88]|uniref:ABC transporter permease subunit n=1 Tax=Pseudoalteromonas sp. KS88 TaxID=2109918 RepID=UPI0010815B8F|nr:ABC transporter permease subunit [Pseudoalteromonas sp. KS88]TGE84764.1 hypothetical protein C7Y70_04245 [Pseudoalteromonas sp. KS88]